MAPKTLEEVVGQSELVAPGMLLRRIIETDRLSSIILFGPPGTGKTSLARVIANTTKLPFCQINAVTSGVAEIKRIVADANNPFITPRGRVVLFIDEIHRFNKAQQDALLPHVEDGTLILIGATTENPFFEVNKALISRSSVFQLKPLEVTDIMQLLKRALLDKENGLGKYRIEIDDETLNYIAVMAGGDARTALNNLELLILGVSANSEGTIVVGLNDVNKLIKTAKRGYDKSGEEHYDTISAFIKSMRGSDPDATLYYLAKMLVSGESIEFIARRIVIAAAEEVGLANPMALVVATSAMEAISKIGMPEARIILSEAALTVATSPKSNASYLAIDRAIADVKSGMAMTIPMYLKNAPVQAMKELGYSNGYIYPHNEPEGLCFQRYLPKELGTKYYYEPTKRGHEKKTSDWLEAFRSERDCHNRDNNSTNVTQDTTPKVNPIDDRDMN